MLPQDNLFKTAVDRYRQSKHPDPLRDIASAIDSVPPTLRAELLIRLLSVHDDQFRDTQNALELETVVAAFPEFEHDINRFYVVAIQSRATDGGERVAAQSLDTLSAEPWNSPVEHDAADLIGGRYRTQQVLGEGTFGVVYFAFDETLQRPVALKLSKARQSESDVVEFNSFLEESRILSALEHPRILPVLDAGVTNDGRQFFVSKYLSGGSLEDRINERGLLPILSSLRIIREIADALQHAHQHGLYHRDVKLANIIFDDVGNPFLADFGLALREAERQQRGGVLAGSPAFMAPEQVKASSTIIDGRTDIWALGVVLYFLLTKQFPFTGGETNAVFQDILQRQPQPPRQINPKVSLPLERLTLRCLEKDISKRFGSAAEMSEELGLLIDSGGGAWSGSLVSGHEPNNRDANGTSGRFVLGAASLVLVTAIAVIGIMAWLNRPTDSRETTKQEVASQRDFASALQAEASVQLQKEPRDPPSSGPTLPTTADTEASDMADIEDLIDKAISENDTDFERPLDHSNSMQSLRVVDRSSGAVDALANKQRPAETPSGILTESMPMHAMIRPMLNKEPTESATRSSIPAAKPGSATIDSDGDRSSLHGWTQLIDEDFSLVETGSVPDDWKDPAGQFQVTDREGRSCLLMPADGMASIVLPDADLENEFEFEFDFALAGGQFASSLIQVDLICPGLPTVTVGVTTNAGKQITSIVGADSRRPASIESVESQSSRLRLAYKDGTLKVFSDDRFCHKMEADFSTTQIRIGLTKYARLFAVRLHSAPIESVNRGEAKRRDWETLFDETFSAVQAGDLPQAWTSDNDLARIEKAGAYSFLAAPSTSLVQIPIDEAIKEDFLLETEIHIPGGYSTTPKLAFVVDSPGEPATEIGCYIYANSFAIQASGVPQDCLRKPWPDYMTDRDAKLRINRSEGRLHIYVGDELFISTRCAHPASGMRLRLDKDVRVHRLRLDRRL